MKREAEPLRGQENRAPVRSCDQPGCGGPGEFRAPKSRDRLDEFHWFCIDHVREYNKAWNYYAGMSQQEVEHETRCDTTWRRPSWPLGARSGGVRGLAGRVADLIDGFGLFGGARRPAPGGTPNGHLTGIHPTSPEARALAIFDLEAPLNLTRLKARYKELVKRHHPDANGGDKLAEERLKDINQAYATLKKFLSA